MNVLIITGIFPPDIGGPATSVPCVAQALTGRGHEVIVITLSDSASSLGQYPFRVVRLRRGRFKPLRFLHTVISLVRHGRRADVLFVNGLFLESVLANFLLRKPLVQKIVGDWAWERACNKGWIVENFEDFQKARYALKVKMLKALRTFWVRRADKIIVPSRYLARWVASWNVPQQKLVVVYNSVEPNSPISGESRSAANSGLTFFPGGEVKGVTMVTVGRLVRWKQVDKIIAAMDKLPVAGLVVIGDGPERSCLEKITRELDLEGRVFFAGQRSKEETLSLVAKCDLFVLNSTYEGLPHVVIEAMSVGLPVVATAVGGTPEVVSDGENGLLIPPTSNGEITTALLRLASSSEERRRLAKGALQTVERFQISKMIEATEAVLTESLG